MLRIKKFLEENKEIKKELINKYNIKKLNEKMKTDYDFKIKELEIIKIYLINENIIPKDFDTGALLDEI